jgi:hypothetical protein
VGWSPVAADGGGKRKEGGRVVDREGERRRERV